MLTVVLLMLVAVLTVILLLALIDLHDAIRDLNTQVSRLADTQDVRRRRQKGSSTDGTVS